MVRTMVGKTIIAGMIPLFWAMADEVQKADNSLSLAEGESWLGGTAPGSGDVAVWDGEVARSGGWSCGLGAGVAWGGLRVTNAVSMLTVTNDGAALSLGGDGINLAAATNGYYCRLYAPVNVVGDQVWRVSSPTVLYLWGPVSGAGALTTGTDVQKGHVVFYDAVDLPKGVTVAGNAQMRTNAVVSGPVTVASGGVLYVNKPDSTDWLDTFATRAVTNDGQFVFGGSQGMNLSLVTFGPGDSLVSPANSSTTRGRVTLYENSVLQDGGLLSNNWAYVNSGCFTQAQGKTFIDYAMHIGYAAPGNLKARCVHVSGGTLDVRRFHVGVANAEDDLGVLEVAGGTTLASRADSWESSGIEIAAVRAVYDPGLSGAPAGRLSVSGGSLRTMQISFGSVMANRGSGWNVTNGYARFDLRGGEVTVGAAGIGPSPVWNLADGGAEGSAWYAVNLSGGTLDAYASYTNRARTKLSDADGGVTVRAADTDGTPRDIVMAEPLTGRGSLRKTGAGALYLKAANTYTGRTVVAEGSLHVTDTSMCAVASGVTLPAPYAVWSADKLTGALGSTVTAWASTNGTWSFNSAIASAINKSFTSPALGSDLLNGHRVVAFNGISNALAMTGNAPTPVSGATELTLAAVVRFGGAGVGGAGDFRTDAGIIGQTLYVTGNASTNWWGIGYSSQGRVGGGKGGLLPGVASAWAAPRELHDGEAHVVIYGWRSSSNIWTSVDGYEVSCASPLSAPMTQSRIILGANEGLLCFKGDVAELQFYRAALSSEQQTRLALELAQRYGVEIARFCADGVVREGPLASREVRVEAGAAFYADANGTPVNAGQVYTGSGTVYGTLMVGTNGVIACGPSEALTVENLVFQPGGVCRVSCETDGSYQPIEVGDLTLPQGAVVVDIDRPNEEVRPRGVLMRYSGDCTDNGVDWRIQGGHSATRVVIDSANREIRLSTPTGTLIRLL